MMYKLRTERTENVFLKEYKQIPLYKNKKKHEKPYAVKKFRKKPVSHHYAVNRFFTKTPVGAKVLGFKSGHL